MLKGARVLLILALGTGGANGAAAQDLAKLCQSAAHLTVGQWASYSRSGGPENGAQLRFAIVGSERRRDTTLYWFEIKSLGAPNPTHDGIAQILIPGFGAEIVGVHALVWKQGDQAPIRPPDEMVSMLSQQVGQSNPVLGLVVNCATARVIGWENVTTAGRSIRALHVVDPEGIEAWRAQEVPFGFVKMHLKDGSTMMLTDQGADAKSSIVGMP